MRHFFKMGMALLCLFALLPFGQMQAKELTFSDLSGGNGNVATEFYPGTEALVKSFFSPKANYGMGIFFFETDQATLDAIEGIRMYVVVDGERKCGDGEYYWFSNGYGKDIKETADGKKYLAVNCYQGAPIAEEGDELELWVKFKSGVTGNINLSLYKIGGNFDEGVDNGGDKLSAESEPIAVSGALNSKMGGSIVVDNTLTTNVPGKQYNDIAQALLEISNTGISETGLTVTVADDQEFVLTKNAKNSARLFLNKEGSEEAPLVIKRSGTGNDAPRVKAYIGGDYYNYIFILNKPNNTTIDGICFEGYESDGITTDNKVYFSGLTFAAYNYETSSVESNFLYKNITIKNCEINLNMFDLVCNGGTPNDERFNGRCIGFRSSHHSESNAGDNFEVENVVFENNVLKNARYGIQMSSGQENAKFGLQIKGNRIERFTTAGINLSVKSIQSGLSIAGNVIGESALNVAKYDNWGTPTAWNIVGLQLWARTVGDPIVIEGNTICNIRNLGTDGGSVRGMVLGRESTKDVCTVYAQNNLFYGLEKEGDTSDLAAIVLDQFESNQCTVRYNTVVLDFDAKGAAFDNFAVKNNYAGGIFVNNIFVNRISNLGGDKVPAIYERGTNASSDRNYFVVGDFKNIYMNGGLHTDDLASFDAWKSHWENANRDQNAKWTAEAAFFADVAQNDYRIADASAADVAFGAPIAEVPKDILGINRNATASTVGAYEVPGKYAVTVNGGNADPATAAIGETVTITLDPSQVPFGKKFVSWSSESGIVFADATQTETSFGMIDGAVSVNANYEENPVTGTEWMLVDMESSVPDGSLYWTSWRWGVADEDDSKFPNPVKSGINVSDYVYKFKQEDSGWNALGFDLKNATDSIDITGWDYIAIDVMGQDVAYTGEQSALKSGGEEIPIAKEGELNIPANEWGTIYFPLADYPADKTKNISGFYTKPNAGSGGSVSYIDNFRLLKLADVTVEGGTASKAQALKGQVVTLAVGEVPEGKVFSKWTSETAGVVFDNAANPNAAFVMPDGSVAISAEYADLDRVYFYEPFDYEEDQVINGINGWDYQNANREDGYRAKGTDPIQYAGITRTPGYFVGGGYWESCGVALPTQNGGALSNDYNADPVGEDMMWEKLGYKEFSSRNNELWFSWIVRLDKDKNPSFSFTDSNIRWNGDNALAKIERKEGKWVLTVGATEIPTTVEATAGASCLLVTKIKFEADKTNVSLYINPSLTGGVPAEAAAEGSTAAAKQLKSICTYLSDDKDAVSMDELRVGSTFAAVTPYSTYSVSVTGGHADKTTALEGETVTLEPEIRNYEELDVWVSEDVTIENNAFVMPAKDVTVTGTYKPFTPVDTKGWFTDFDTQKPDNFASDGEIIDNPAQDAVLGAAKVYKMNKGEGQWKNFVFEYQKSAPVSIEGYDVIEFYVRGEGVSMDRVLFQFKDDQNVSKDLNAFASDFTNPDGWNRVQLPLDGSVNNMRVLSFFPQPETEAAGTYYLANVRAKYSVKVTNGSASVTAANEGDEVTLVADEAPEGKIFDKWEAPEGVTITDNVFVMPNNKVAVTAVFKNIDYTLSVTGASGTPATATFGEVITLVPDEASIPAGEEFDKWVSDDVEITGNTFTMPSKDVTIAAQYKKINYTITVVGGTADKETATMGETVTIVPLLTTCGGGFKEWIVEEGDIVITEVDESLLTYSFVMPAGNVAIRASYYDGIDESTEVKNLSVYPNPATDFIKVDGLENASYRIVNAGGTIVLSGKGYNGESIDITSLSSGNYIFQTGENATHFIKK